MWFQTWQTLLLNWEVDWCAITQVAPLTRTFAREILFFMAEEVRSGIREDFMKSKFSGRSA
jgi:hypothetical protein